MPSAGRTLYDILGLTRDASAEAITSAYRARLVEIGGTHDATVAIREAYQVLSNPERRKKYDAKLARATPAAAKPAPSEPAPRRGSRKLNAFIGMSVLALLAGVIGWKLKPAPPPPAIVAATVAPRIPEPETPAAEEEEATPEEAASTPPAEVRPPPPVITPILARKELPPQELSERFSYAMMLIKTEDAKGRFLAQGTGVFLDRNTVITNCHILKDAHRIVVQDPRDIEATVTVADEERDLCKLRVPNMYEDHARNITMAPLSDLRTGQRVYAIAAAWDLQRSISEGMVNSMRDDGQRALIQISNPVNPAWDGGGLFTADGRLVGILTTRHPFGSGFNAAIPVDGIQNMRASRVAFPTPADTPREVVTSLMGRWRCTEPWEKRNGIYEYGADGSMKITYDRETRTLTAPYRLDGMTIHLRTDHGGDYRFQIESISAGRMIQYFDAGRRLNCQRES